METTNLATRYDRWLTGLWQAPPERMVGLARELFTEDAVGHWSRGDAHGPEGIAANVRETTALFDEVRTELLVGPVVDGALVSAVWRFSGRVRAGVPGVTAEPGALVTFTGADMFRAVDTRFAEYWPHGDALSCLSQLGMVRMTTP
ncbi:ester cyclase [Actinoalloteichus spitiensis]|uniref:ester cyclase n=1 Tax=Actinoalloteichus spitiensis TaxID=252394 RepID=UPI000382C973|nr:ester cyclase [Actinoalloteichus spitiensis]